MEKEFNLSEKITNVVNLNNEDISSIPVKYIKEFIKRLKEKLRARLYWENEDLIPRNMELMEEQIDKLAGDKLI